jgi:hypothetical protein
MISANTHKKHPRISQPALNKSRIDLLVADPKGFAPTTQRTNRLVALNKGAIDKAAPIEGQCFL